MIPGEYFLSGDPVECNAGRATVKITVVNTGDRPVQIGSHFHFFEVNRQIEFDREKAFGMRLNIPSATAVRFEPGEEKEVELVEFGGRKIIYGFNSLVNGYTGSGQVKAAALAKLERGNYKIKKK